MKAFSSAASPTGPSKSKHRVVRLLLWALLIGLFSAWLFRLLTELGILDTAPAVNTGPLLEADRVLVRKSERRLYLMKNDKVFREYRIALGDSPQGHKQQEGDERTPEGDYVLDWRNPNSVAYKSLHVSYPNAADRARARKQGVSPGGNIMVHGILNGYGEYGPLMQQYDWTDGCIAVLNREMEEIWQSVRNGTPIRIEP
jgi:murein L,D-transpeptidase YafK